MAEVLLPRPDNVRGRFGAYVTSDVYDVALRLQEVDPRLYVQVLDPPVHFGDKTFNFAIVEQVGEMDYLVTRVEHLDARVVEHVQYLQRVPFEKRFAEAERLEAKLRQEADDKAFEDFYERVGGPMIPLLERTGFIDTRNQSFARTNPTARRARAERTLKRLSADDLVRTQHGKVNLSLDEE